MAESFSKNVTALNHEMYHGWMIPPTTRGTSQVLYGCLLTISICIYNSIHLNIPEPNEKKRWQILRRIKWVVIGVFAPELVLFAAWVQLSQAQRLISRMCEVAPDLVYMELSTWQKLCLRTASWFRNTFNTKSATIRSDAILQEWSRDSSAISTTKSKDLRHKIDLSYGFYAVMGGFRVDTTDLHDEITSMALSFKQLLRIVESKHPFALEAMKSLLIELQTIQDRSKANNLTKILICCQVLGTAFQCVARKAYGPPLALLEWHTFAHVVCAVGIYAVWFSKPLDVNEATIVKLPPAFKVGLAQSLIEYQPKTWSCQIPDNTGAGYMTVLIREDVIAFGGKSILPQLVLETSVFDLEAADHEPYQFGSVDDEVCSKTAKALRWFEVYYERDNKVMVKIDLAGVSPLLHTRQPIKHFQSAKVELNPIDQHRWSILQSSKKERKIDHEGGYSYFYTLRQSNYFGTRKQWNVNDSSSGHDSWDRFFVFSGIESLGDTQAKTIYAGVCIVGLYGGIHALAWNSHFPSTTEMWFWRASCISLMSFAPLFILQAHVGTLKAIENTWLESAIVWSAFLELVLFTPIYILSRIFVVIETLISLRSVPLGVYATVSWAQYIPHL